VLVRAPTGAQVSEHCIEHLWGRRRCQKGPREKDRRLPHPHGYCSVDSHHPCPCPFPSAPFPAYAHLSIMQGRASLSASLRQQDGGGGGREEERERAKRRGHKTAVYLGKQEVEQPTSPFQTGGIHNLIMYRVMGCGVCEQTRQTGHAERRRQPTCPSSFQARACMGEAWKRKPHPCSASSLQLLHKADGKGMLQCNLSAAFCAAFCAVFCAAFCGTLLSGRHLMKR
jgi:hypothetical protein